MNELKRVLAYLLLTVAPFIFANVFRKLRILVLLLFLTWTGIFLSCASTPLLTSLREALTAVFNLSSGFYLTLLYNLFKALYLILDLLIKALATLF